jgi:uncharacterized protein YndB with AHSA1/START domain
MARKKSEPVVESLAILRPVERVWAALTSPRDLGTLLLGRVRMGAEPGAAMMWEWGIWEDAAPRGKGTYTWTGKVLDVVPGATLVLGPDPVVTITVKGQRDAALVTITQGVPTGEKTEDYEHGWADFLLRLKTHVETEGFYREVLARALVQAKPQQVYKALLDRRALAKILPGKAKLKAKAGERFSWQHKKDNKAKTGTLLELHKNRRIVLTWEATDPATQVSLEAQAMPYGTLVSAHHVGLMGMNRMELYTLRLYWLRLLERLRCYFYFKGKIKTTG